MPTMAKKKPQGRSPAWVLNLRLDEDLKPMVEEYQASPKREFPPNLTQVFERALKLLLKEDGIEFPKPKQKPKPPPKDES